MTAIVPADILWYLSNPNANTGYTGIGTAGNSLGKYISTTQVSATPLDNLFLDLTGAQNAGDQVDYQCVFVMNNTASGNTMNNVYVWLPSQLYTTGGAAMALGADPIGPVPYNQSFQQATYINYPTSQPAGIPAWYGPSSQYPQGCPVSPIPPQYCQAIWVQRTATDSGPFSPQSFSLQVTFNTNA